MPRIQQPLLAAPLDGGLGHRVARNDDQTDYLHDEQMDSQQQRAHWIAVSRLGRQRRALALVLALICLLLILLASSSSYLNERRQRPPANPIGQRDHSYDNNNNNTNTNNPSDLQEPAGGKRILISLQALAQSGEDNGLASDNQMGPTSRLSGWWPSFVAAGKGRKMQTLAPASERASPVQSIRIMCSILTINSTRNQPKSEAVTKTWAKRCDKFLLVQGGSPTSGHQATSNGQPDEQPRPQAHAQAQIQVQRPPEQQLGLAEPIPQSNGSQNKLIVPIKLESRDELWHKVVKMFESLYANHLNEFHWFMKADDDTYVLMDSLRDFLISRSRPEEPIYFGHRFKPYVRQGYMSGGSGYVLSREALRRLVELGFRKNLSACQLIEGKVEDVQMGKCLEAVGVKAGDTRDSAGRETFIPLSPAALLQGNLDAKFWYFKYNFYNQTGQQGKECCSNKPIAFHYIQPDLMYLIDWLLYDVKEAQRSPG